ncbi:toll/interleukin-1 receptor domain-containing protein [Methylobacterium sp. Leaf100]|uniref:toll/interleukin-1 receptor domain-containing protein n=1 Tax=Methylobacterium sp. Leaf100 TaxID=1736252 RepID=UPI0032976C46
MASWLDAQHQKRVIAPHLRRQRALHVVDAVALAAQVAATGRIRRRPTLHPMHRRESAGGARSGGGSSSTRPRWSRFGSTVTYTPVQMQALSPIRDSVEKQAALDLRDVFLCHAWDDRNGPAKELHDLLEARGVKVWFSEKDISLGVPLMRAIDRGLANSRIGLVLVH